MMKTSFPPGNYWACLAMFFIVIWLQQAQATSITPAASGNWSSTSTWNGGAVPTSTDSVLINGGYTVTVDISGAAAKYIRVGINASGAGTLVMTSGSDLTVTVLIYVGDVSAAGTFTMVNGCTVTTGGFYDTQSATFNVNAGTLVLTNSNALPGHITDLNDVIINAGGGMALNYSVALHGTLTNNGNVFAFNSTTQITGGTITGTGNLKVEAKGNADDLTTQYTGTLDLSNLTVYYDASNGATQTIGTTRTYKNIIATCSNLAVSAGVTATVTGTLTINNLVPASTAVINSAAFAANVSNIAIAYVTATGNNDDVATQYTGTTNFNTAKLQFAGTSPQVTNSNISAKAFVIANTAGKVTFTGAMTSSSSSTINTGDTLYMSASATLSNTITASATGAVLVTTATGNANDFSTQFPNAVTMTNITVIFAGASAQTCGTAIRPSKIIINSTLTISATASVTSTTINAGGNLIISASTQFSSSAVTGNGTLTILKTGTADDISGAVRGVITYTNLTLNFAGTAAQSTALTGKSPYAIIIANTASTVTFTGNFTPGAGGTTVNSGATLILGATNTISGAITGAGTIKVTATGNTNDLTTQYTGALDLSNMTVQFAGAATQATNAAFSCKNLNIINTSGAVTLNGATTVSASVSISASATLTIGSGGSLIPGAACVVSGSGTLNGSGTIYISATGHTNDLTTQYTVSTLTLTGLSLNFSGAGAQAINANPSVPNITISNTSAPVNFNASVTVSGTTTVNSHAVLGMSPSSVLSGAVIGAGTIVVTATGNTNDLTTQYTGTITVTNVKYQGSGSGQKLPAGTYNSFAANNASGVTLNGDITVSDSISLTSGNITLGPHNVVLNSGGTFKGGSSSSYLKITGAGRVIAKNITSATLIPVGDDYSPVQISNGGGADYTIGLQDTVTDNGGSPILSSHAVGITWSITPSISVSNVSITLQWPANMELGSFDRTSCYLAYRTSPTDNWTPLSAGTAASGTDPYTQTATISSMTGGTTYYFGIGDGSGASALPVTLVQFDASAHGHAVKLNWSTATEINNNFFEVERSADAQTWQAITRVAGHGSTTVTSHYEATDNLQDMGIPNILYYRLKQADYNGTFNYSAIKPVYFTNLQANALQMYPNPTAGAINILWQRTGNTPAVIKLINISGQTLYSQTLEGKGLIQHEINLSAYPAGAYEVQVVDGDKVKVERVWKE